jgi:hypothetical protein
MNPANSFIHEVPGLAEYAATLKPESPDEQAARDERERRADADALRSSVSRDDLLRDRGIPAKDRRRVIADKLRNTRSMIRARSWVTEPRRGLVIAGPPDAGKTTAASWLGSQEPSAADLRFWKSRTGQPVVVFVAAEFLLGAYHARGRERDPITGRNLLDLLSCWLLIVDDVGQEAGVAADMVGEALDVLTRRRSDAGLRWVITTNLDQPDAAGFSARYGARGQRLRETLIEHGVFFTAPAEGLRRGST